MLSAGCVRDEQTDSRYLPPTPPPDDVLNNTDCRDPGLQAALNQGQQPDPWPDLASYLSHVTH